MKLTVRACVVAGFLAAPALALAQEPPTPPEPVDAHADPPVESADLFGRHLEGSERFRISGVFIAGWSHDGAQAQLGFENQGRVGQATLAVAGRLTDRVRYFVSFNPVNETGSRPSCGEEHFFFPNDPSFYTSGPDVTCDPEDGSKRVDTYNTYALDYIVQQGPLREGYVDYRASDALSVRFGRFILPIGFEPVAWGRGRRRT